MVILNIRHSRIYTTIRKRVDCKKCHSPVIVYQTSLRMCYPLTVCAITFNIILICMQVKKNRYTSIIILYYYSYFKDYYSKIYLNAKYWQNRTKVRFMNKKTRTRP